MLVSVLQVLGVVAVLAGVALAFPLAVTLVVDGTVVLVLGVALELIAQKRETG